MEILLSNPSCVVSAERFLEKIWGYDAESDVNVVWVYISYLRKKLGLLQANIQIKTTRNAGYSLEEI
jgi:DNA-binding response OmpR family regulator